MWLILGGDGYVGTHLRREFTERGVEFTSKDRGDGDFRERVDPGWLGSCDAVLLLAGSVRAPTREELLSDNLRIVRRVIGAYEQGEARPPLFFLSSLHVYRPSDRPVGVDAPTLPPASFYGAVKLACEAILSEAAAREGFGLWIGRASNLVALEPPLNPASFVAEMRRSLEEDGVIRIRRDPVRDLVDIHDFAVGLEVRREAGVEAGEIRCENVCSGVGRELRDVAEAAIEEWRGGGRSAELLARAAGEADVMLGVPPEDRAWGGGVRSARIGRLIGSE